MNGATTTALSTVVLRTGIIYRYTLIKECDEKGKSYIGKTTEEKKRSINWKKADNTSYGGLKITEARRKYGVSSTVWKYDVVERIEMVGKDEFDRKMKERETYWITDCDSVKNGFNSSYGDGNLGAVFSETHKARISKNHRHINSQTMRDKLSEKLKGREIDAATKAKISAGNKGKKRTSAQNQAQSQRMKGKNPSAATQGAKNWVENNGGGYWKNHAFSQSSKANMKAAQQAKGTSTRAIFPDGHTEDFNTMLDAAKATGLNVGSVANAIKTGGTCKNGMKFERI